MVAWTAQQLLFATLLAAVVRLVVRVGRLGPASRHALWVIVLVKLLVPPAVVLHLPWVWPAPIAHLEAVAFDKLTGGGAAIGSEPISRSRIVAAAISTSWLPGVSWRAVGAVGLAIWIIGGLVMAAVQFVRAMSLASRIRSGTEPDRTLTDEVESLARQLNVCAPAVRLVTGIPSPLVCAVGRPLLLWPTEVVTSLPSNSSRALLAHELAHLKRRDHWIAWIELAAGCLWWWNPLFWFVKAQLREEAELACDAWVIHTLPDGRRAYAEALLTVCAGLPAGSTSTPMTTVGVSPGSRRALERRLVMIMRHQSRPRASRSLALVAAMLTLVTLPVWAQKANPPVRSDRVFAALLQQKGLVIQPAAAGRGPFMMVTSVLPMLSPAGLPADAQDVLASFAERAGNTMRETNAKIATERARTIQELSKLEDKYSRAAQPDKAAAVHRQIELMQRGRR
jgi:beta-lactamase regulating signal transducer with metallopeptidase domain